MSKIDEILEEYKNKIQNLMMDMPYELIEEEYALTFAKHALLEELRGVVEDKLIDTYVEFGCEQPHDDYALEKGFNQANAQWRAKLEEVLG